MFGHMYYDLIHINPPQDLSFITLEYIFLHARQFSMMECVMTAFLDEYPQYLKTSKKREILFRVLMCVFCFLISLPMTTQVCLLISILINQLLIEQFTGEINSKTAQAYFSFKVFQAQH